MWRNRSGGWFRWGMAWALLGLSVPVSPAQDAATATGTVQGKVKLDLPGVSLADVGPLIVFLDAVEGKLRVDPPKDTPKISQREAKFSPDFLVIAAGQTVEMPNDDKIVHNVFSFSKPNDFDLGLYPKGEQKKVTFLHPGVVDLFCSIHSKMNATIFVAPSPYYSQADAEGAFEIRGVPPGRYRLKTWNRKLPAAGVEIAVAAGKPTRLNVDIQDKK